MYWIISFWLLLVFIGINCLLDKRLENKKIKEIEDITKKELDRLKKDFIW